MSIAKLFWLLLAAALIGPSIAGEAQATAIVTTADSAVVTSLVGAPLMDRPAVGNMRIRKTVIRK